MENRNGVIDDALFLTGAQRSGTTLLEKLLAAQPHISLLSQPFPLLFVEAKRAFLHSIGSDGERYPLGHLFGESRYRQAALDHFLGGWRISPEELQELFARMSAYSGQYTRFPAAALDDVFRRLSSGHDFAAVVDEIDHGLADQSDAEWFGSKETICEEFVPYLLARGFRCVIILRDPRDLITSLNHGRGLEFGGEIKPILFNIRSWRKSVSFARTLETHPRFHWCRYEDLVRDPASTLSRLAERLFIADVQVRPIENWAGNSSHREHEGISKSSIGVYQEMMPPAASRLIEAACLPEMQILGYETSMTREDALQTLAGLFEPYPSVRTGMERDGATPENAAAEIERLNEVWP